jgi:phosphoglycerate dehydrogenase-like enzyme
MAFDPYLQKLLRKVVDGFDTVLKESDFISIHCPLTEVDSPFDRAKRIPKMEKKPLLINTSRGPIIDEKALIQALVEGPSPAQAWMSLKANLLISNILTEDGKCHPLPSCWILFRRVDP